MVNLEEKLLTMTTADLIRAMTAGLRTRHTEIEMGSYGHIKEGVCFGCAATNAIIEVTGLAPKDHIESMSNPIRGLGALERLLNALRLGSDCGEYYNNPPWDVRQYLDSLNRDLNVDHFSHIYFPKSLCLPQLTNDYTEEDLKAYDELADAQLTDKGVNDSDSEK